MNREHIDSCYIPAAKRALESFPVEADKIEFVTQSENVTFRVSVDADDTDYVLRFHRPGYNSIEELESERAWIADLKKAGVVVQDSVKSILGGNYVLVDIPETGEQIYVGLTTWHEGIPLRDHLAERSDSLERTRFFRRLGGIAAAMHNQSAGWEPPSGFIRHRLDLNSLLGEEPFWGRFWEHTDLTESEITLLLEAREKARSFLEAYGETSANFSLIHSDLTPDNIIVDGENLAVIDFDDTAFGWHMYDIASIMVECQGERDYQALEGALLDGYCEYRGLSAKDISMLPVFLLVRGMAIIGWYHLRPEHSGSPMFEKNKQWALNACALQTPCLL